MREINILFKSKSTALIFELILYKSWNIYEIIIKFKKVFNET